MTIERYDPNTPPSPEEWQALDEEEAWGLIERHHRERDHEHAPSANPRLHVLIHAVVESQAAMGDQLRVATTLQRLVDEGLSRHDAVHAVGAVVADDIHQIMQQGQPFDDAMRVASEAKLDALTAAAWQDSFVADASDVATSTEAADVLTTETVRDLDDDELFALLFSEEDRLPRCVVDEICARRERFTDRLIAVLIDSRNWDVEDSSWWTPIHATFILGAIDDPMADIALLSAMRDAHRYDYDWLSAVIASILGRRGARIQPILTQIALDPKENEFVRSDALFSLAATTLHAADRVAEVFATTTSLFLDASGSSVVRGTAGCILLDFQIAEQRAALVAYAEQEAAMHPQAAYFSKEQVDEAFAGSPHTALYGRDWLEFYAESAIAARQARWEAEEQVDDQDCGDPHCLEHHHGYAPDSGEPERIAVRSAPKVGRNDPCPCGSGKKYKKCCAP